MRQVMQALPHEKIIYFGDTARVPYGNKSRETIIRYSQEIGDFLTSQNIKVLVIACNTASAYALEALEQTLSIPVIGVIEPGAEKATSITRTGKIAVLGTRATIKSDAYKKAIHAQLEEADVLSIPCPLLVPLVEENFIEQPVTRLILEYYLKDLSSSSVDTLLLGCTHYPLLKKAIQEVVGPSIQIVDSATTCAEAVKEVLERHHLTSSHPYPRFPIEHQFFVSDDPEKFQLFGETFLGFSIPAVKIMHDFREVSYVSSK